MAQSVFATEGITRSATLWTGLPESIVLPPITLSGRKDYAEADIASLAHDIATNGQDTPIKIRKDAQGRPVLVYGRRRLLAVQYANKHQLGKNGPIQIEANYESKMTEEDALIAAIRENWQRKDVSDADHAFNIGQLIKFAKKTVEQIAEIYFPAATTVEAKADAVRWVKVRGQIDKELIDEGKQAMREGVVSTTTATELAKLTPETQREVIADPKSKKTVKGKARITVSAVKAHKPAPVSRKPIKAESNPAPKLPATVYAAAEEMARAIELWDKDGDSEKAEDALLASVTAYRQLVPSRAAAKRESHAA